MRCGFELEVAEGAGAVLEHLQALNLTQHDHLHRYHCDCELCSPRQVHRDGSFTMPEYLLKAQEDCTADGEFISMILEYGSPEFDRAIRGMSVALLKGCADTSGDVGNHVHIDRSGLDAAGALRLFRLFARYERELFDIAAAGHGNMRGYNGRGMDWRPELWTDTEPNPRRGEYHYFDGGHTLSWKSATVEFRLWNSTREAWRIRTHIGLSHAMVAAAIDGVDVGRRDTRCVEQTIGDYIDSETWAGILRQRFNQGGIAAAA